jgi:hypothetical protein
MALIALQNAWKFKNIINPVHVSKKLDRFEHLFVFKVNPFVDPVLITCSSIYQYNKEDTWRCIAGLCERKKVLTNSQLAICE